MISSTACRADGAASDGDETGATGETGADAGSCEGEWQTFVETQPFFGQPHGEDDLFVWSGAELILSWDPVAGWREQQAPGLLDVELTWASAPDDVFMLAVMEQDGFEFSQSIVHWDGAMLDLSMAIPDDERVFDLDGAGPGDVWVVGELWCQGDPGCEARVFHFDGQTWSEHALPGVRGLWTVWARGPDDVYASGAQTVHYDGTDWTVVVEDAPTMRMLTGDGSRVLATDGGRLYELHDTTWELIPTPGGIGSDLFSVAIIDDSVWVQGTYADEERMSRLQGGEWQSFVLPPGLVWWPMVTVGARPWMGVENVEPDLGHEVWEVADIEEIETIYVDSSIDHIDQIAGSRRDGVYATAINAQRGGVAKLGEYGWQWLVTDLEDVEVLDIQVDPEGGVWIAGADYVAHPPPILWRVEGDQAVPVDSTVGLDAGSRALWVGGEDDVWLLGGDDAHHFDGESWFSLQVPAGARRIESAGGHVYLWTGTTIYELRNGAWIALLVADEQFVAAAVAGPLSVWAVERHDLGEFRVRAFDGETWTTHDMGTRGLCGVGARGPDDVDVYGYWQEPGGAVHGVLMHWDGGGWTSAETPATQCVDVLPVEDGVLLNEGGSTHVFECTD